ncbi:unnamed protein product [Candida parapsilosis]
MTAITTPVIHNFTLKKYSKFDHDKWIHQPYRTDLSITFIETATINNKDVDVIVHWKGSSIDKFTLFLTDKVKTSVLVKSPNIGVKQCIVSTDNLILRFQISLVDDAEFEKCRQFLQSKFQQTSGLNTIDGSTRQVQDISSQVRQEMKQLASFSSNTINSLASEQLLNIVSFSQPAPVAIGNEESMFDLQSQILSQKQSQPQVSLHQSEQKQTQRLAELSPQNIQGSQTAIQSQNTWQAQEIGTSQQEPQMQNPLTLQQLQQQFLKWQQNLVQQSHGYRVLPQSPLHCAFPIESYNLSQSPPELQQHRVLQQSQFYVQEPQNPTHALDTSTSSTNQVPSITINDLVELETLSDSQLNALIHRQCQSVQFRDFVKRLDKIMEKNS